MLSKLYVVYDCVSEEYSSPMAYRNDSVAARAVSLSLEKSENVDIKDFQLFFIGSYDHDNANLNVETLRLVSLNKVVDDAE